MRRKNHKKRQIAPDPIYNSVLLEKFINLVMIDGKKSLSERIVYTVLDKLEKEHKRPALELFEEALDKARPDVILKARRVGGSNFQVPTPIDREKGQIIAMRWIIEAARKRKGAPIIEDLTREINDILADQGEVLKKKEDTHRMAEANRAYSHFIK